MKQKYQDQAHMIMKLQFLNMEVKNSPVMDLDQSHNSKIVI